MLGYLKKVIYRKVVFKIKVNKHKSNRFVCQEISTLYKERLRDIADKQ